MDIVANEDVRIKAHHQPVYIHLVILCCLICAET